MIQAPDETGPRAAINRALISVGVPVPNYRDDLLYCIAVTGKIVRRACEATGYQIESMTDTDRFVTSIFGLVVGEYLSDLLGVSAKIVLQSVPAELFGQADAERMDGLMTSYDRLILRTSVVRTIGVSVAVWLADPRKKNFDALSDLIRACFMYS